MKQGFRILGTRGNALTDKHLTAKIKINMSSTQNLCKFSTVEGLKIKYMSFHAPPKC